MIIVGLGPLQDLEYLIILRLQRVKKTIVNITIINTSIGIIKLKNTKSRLNHLSKF